MEEKFTLISAFPYNLLLKYFDNPRNIMRYIPFFKEIREIDKNVYLVKVGWIFNIEIKVFKITSKNRITYLVEHTTFPRMIAKLDHLIQPKQGASNLFEVEITFYYNGPFERLVRNQARKIYEKIKDKFSIEGIDEAGLISLNENTAFPEKEAMKTILSGTIDMNEIENLIAKAILESQNNEVELIIGEGSKQVKFLFINGSLVSHFGSIDDLKGRNKFLLRKKE